MLDWPTLDPTSANVRSYSLSPLANPTNFIGSNQPIQLVGLANVGSNLGQCHLTVSLHQPIQPTLLDPTLDPISQSNMLDWPTLDPTSANVRSYSLSPPANPTNFIGSNVGSNQPIQLVGLANVGSNLSQCQILLSLTASQSNQLHWIQCWIQPAKPTCWIGQRWIQPQPMSDHTLSNRQPI